MLPPPPERPPPPTTPMASPRDAANPPAKRPALAPEAAAPTEAKIYAAKAAAATPLVAPPVLEVKAAPPPPSSTSPSSQPDTSLADVACPPYKAPPDNVPVPLPPVATIAPVSALSPGSEALAPVVVPGSAKEVELIVDGQRLQTLSTPRQVIFVAINGMSGCGRLWSCQSSCDVTIRLFLKSRWHVAYERRTKLLHMQPF